MKKQINEEFHRMQQLAGLINKSQLNEAFLDSEGNYVETADFVIRQNDIKGDFDILDIDKVNLSNHVYFKTSYKNWNKKEISKYLFNEILKLYKGTSLENFNNENNFKPSYEIDNGGAFDVPVVKIGLGKGIPKYSDIEYINPNSRELFSILRSEEFKTQLKKLQLDTEDTSLWNRDPKEPIILLAQKLFKEKFPNVKLEYNPKNGSIGYLPSQNPIFDGWKREPLYFEIGINKTEYTLKGTDYSNLSKILGKPEMDIKTGPGSKAKMSTSKKDIIFKLQNTDIIFIPSIIIGYEDKYISNNKSNIIEYMNDYGLDSLSSQ